MLHILKILLRTITLKKYIISGSILFNGTILKFFCYYYYYYYFRFFN